METQACPSLEVTWNTPGASALDSMPLGNGDIGVNVWTEVDGVVRLFVGKNDSWDENGRLLKLGRLRLSFPGRSFSAGIPFRQTLWAARGEIEIAAGKREDELRMRVWVDARRPVVWIEAEADVAQELEVRLEPWRTVDRELEPVEDHCPVGKRSSAERTVVTADRFLDVADALAWAHHNERSAWRATLEHQDLGGLIPDFRDPLLGLTSGALVAGPGLGVVDRLTLRSAGAARRFVVGIHPLVLQAGSVDEWLAAVRGQAAEAGRLDLRRARQEHRAWWKGFWERSRIALSGSPEADTVSRGYNLQRFLQACASRGRFPMKFNGSIFTVDGTRGAARTTVPVPEAYDADYRLWGGGYWFQNVRLLYWPMLMAGDFDLMEPFFRLYRDLLPFAEARTRAYFGHGGAFFPETMTFWGTYLNENYGYDRSGATTPGSDVIAASRGGTRSGPWKPGEVANTYIGRYWQGGLELLAMMLDHHAITQDPAFVRDAMLPLARSILTFYREHFPRRDEDGRMVISPAQSLETWHVAVNPLPDIAGLHWVTERLLELPGLSEADRKAWAELRGLLPPVPSRAEYWNKKRYLIPALQYDVLANLENPELYGVFPYRLYGVGKAGLETGRETFARRLFKETGCWRQDSIHAAMLGLTDDARRDVVHNFSGTHPSFRFPAFWGPNFDWIPDHDNGGSAMIALQRMLLQWEGRRLLLMPAWPKEWDVDFMLHAPFQTVVQCVYRDGEVRSLKVAPEARLRDVEIWKEDQAPP